MPRFLVLMLCFAFLGSGTAEARPKTSKKLAREAKKHLKTGLKQIGKGRVDRGIESLQISYSLDPVPVVLFHIAEAHNGKKEYKEALYHYRKYLEEEPKAAKARGVDAIIEALTQMEAETAEKTAEPPPVAEQPPPAPEPAPEPPAPSPVVAVSPTPPVEDEGFVFKVAGTMTFGAGVALLGAGGYFAVVANRRSDELSELFAQGGTWSDRYDDKWDEGESARKRAIVFAAVGGAAAVTGVVLYLLGRRAGRRVEVAAVPVAGGGEVAFGWAF